MSPSRTVDLAWRKANSSGNTGQCVEVAALPVGTAAHTAVRDSKNPDGSVLYFSSAAWRAFVTAVKTAEHDL